MSSQQAWWVWLWWHAANAAAERCFVCDASLWQRKQLQQSFPKHWHKKKSRFTIFHCSSTRCKISQMRGMSCSPLHLSYWIKPPVKNQNWTDKWTPYRNHHKQLKKNIFFPHFFCFACEFLDLICIIVLKKTTTLLSILHPATRGRSSEFGFHNHLDEQFFSPLQKKTGQTRTRVGSRSWWRSWSPPLNSATK